MSIFTQYHPETGVVFDELDDLIATLTAGGGAGASPTATATPKATSTPSPGTRTAQISGKWYVIDGSGQPISPPYGTKSEAMYAAQYVYPAVTATPGAFAPTSTPMPTPSNYVPGPNTEGMYSQEMLGMADVGAGPTAAVQSGGLGGIGGITGTASGASTMGPAGRTAAQVAGTAYLNEAEAAWYRALPTSVKAAVEGGTGGTGSGGSSAATGTAGGTATSAKPPAAPPQLQGLLDSFEGFSDKDVVEAYYKGEIDREQLAALITVRNTSDKGVPKYTTASLDRYLTQVDEAKPEPKRTALDVLGERFGNISRDFNMKDPQFGGQGTFGSSTAGQGIMDKNLFTPTSGGQGKVPMSTPGGNLGLAATVVDNQLYPAYSAMAPDVNGKYGNPQDEMRAFYNGPSGILQQSGIYVDPRTSPATQMQAVGNLIALREFFMSQNPNLDASDANALAVATMQPANPKYDPSATQMASWSDPVGTMDTFAKGGSMTLKEPTIGMGLYSRRPQFIAAEGGKQERVESDGDSLKFTPMSKDIKIGRELPAQANAMAQSRAFGQRGMMMGRDQVSTPEGTRKAPSTQMLTLMRILGIPGFATGGAIDYVDLSNPAYMDALRAGTTRLPSTYTGWTPPTFGGIDYQQPPSYPTTPGSQISLDSLFGLQQSALQGAHTEQRQSELDAYKAALNDVAGISNIGRLQRQRDAYDPRFAMAGMRAPTEVKAPLTGPMGALPPGVRYALETPADRESQLSNLNERDRQLELARLQAPDAETRQRAGNYINSYYAAPNASTRNEYLRDLSDLLGVEFDTLIDIFRPTLPTNRN